MGEKSMQVKRPKKTALGGGRFVGRRLSQKRYTDLSNQSQGVVVVPALPKACMKPDAVLA